MWDLLQHFQIEKAREEARDAATKTETQDARLRRLEDRVDQLSLACQGMWELLRENSSLTEDDLKERMLEIDGRDGKVDGKLGAQTFECGECGRKTSSRRPYCVFCGAPATPPDEHAFGPA